MKRFDSFALDTSNLCLWREGTQIDLPPKPFAVLRYLVENPGRLITHDELLDALWPETYVQPQVLRTYMLELRKILGDDPAQPRFIQTLPKRGYCFLAKVVDFDPAALSTRVDAARHEAHPAGLLGRDRELAILNMSMDLFPGGRRQVVFVTGEPGIGKTALVDAFCLQFEQSPSVVVARGQCIEGFAKKEEYYPVMEALGRLCASPDGERACRILSRMAPLWMTPGAHGAEAATTVPQPAPERMAGDLCAALEELAAEKPLVLVFEDLHWADDATLHLISALARRRAGAQLMVLATFRPQEGGPDQLLKGLKQDLLLRRLCAEIALEPLTKPAVVELLSRELKQETLPPGLASFVHQHSEGNPLFAIAILEHLMAQGFLARKTAGGRDRRDQQGQRDQWEQCGSFHEMEASVPDGLAQMIEVEIERLSLEEQRLLEAGSLIRVAFPAWAVAAALGEDLAETEEACDGLARRLYFLQRVGKDELPDGTTSAFYVFAHELYREVLYQRQVAARRAKRHTRIAERLGELFTGREADVAREIAMHYEAAGDWRRAVKALRGAALHAFPRQAYAESVELLEHALRITEALGGSEQSEEALAILDSLAASRAALIERMNQHRNLPEKV